MSFAPYDAYKESREERLGKVPAHWSLVATKRVATFTYGDALPQDTRNEDGDIPVFGSNGSFGRHDVSNTRAPTVFVGRKGSFGALNWSDVPSFGIDTVYFVDERNSRQHLRWLFWALHILGLDTLSQDTGVPGLARETVYETKLPLPTRSEQFAIAAFLDRETAKIDALVEEQQRLIELLKEKRQAVISHAVNKGLNPNAPMKDSGVEWLGEVPKHWMAVQLGRLCRQVSDGPHFSPKYVDEGVMFLSARNVKVDGWSLDDAKFISEDDCAEFDRRVIPERGDILYTKGGTTGIARVVDLDQRFQVWVHIAVLKIELAAANPYYLAYALNSVGCYEQSQLYTRGATNNDLGLTRLIKIWLALPPLDEQGRIATYLQKHTEQLDELIRAAEQAIELFRERRAALISAAVTGKIDVRGVVEAEAQFPDVVAA